jgi:hypothetical protein
VVKVSHYVHLPVSSDLNEATQVVNETPAPPIVGVLGLNNVFSDTHPECDSAGSGSPLLRVHFSRISHRLVDSTLENDVRVCDAGHGHSPNLPYGS